MSVDPYAWLKLIYSRLRYDPAFALLAPAHQFVELCRVALLERAWSDYMEPQ